MRSRCARSLKSFQAAGPESSPTAYQYYAIAKRPARLSKESIKQLEDSLDSASEFMPEARLLSGFPSGQLEQGRPRIRRLEQIGNLNALIDVNFPYGAEVNRVIFMLWLDAQLRVEAGDIETALVEIRAIANAGRSVGDYPGLSAQMTRSARSCKRCRVSRRHWRKAKLGLFPWPNYKRFSKTNRAIRIA